MILWYIVVISQFRENNGDNMNAYYETKTNDAYHSLDYDLTKAPHLHKQLEIMYVKSGHTFAYADNKNYELNTGDLFITFPNQIHYYEKTINGQYSVMIFSPETIVDSSTLLLSSIPINNVIHTDDIKELKSILSKIRKAEGNYRNIALNGYYNVMMSLILPKLTLKKVNVEKNTSLHNIMEFCCNSFSENITLDYIAEKLHLSKYYISHLINSNLNLKFNDYINNLRISKACDLLKESDMKIADISEDVGFGTIRSFNRSFKNIMGCQPAEYRNAVKELT